MVGGDDYLLTDAEKQLHDLPEILSSGVVHCSPPDGVLGIDIHTSVHQELNTFIITLREAIPPHIERERERERE